MKKQILSFIEYIKESINDNFLYHWVSMTKMKNIINENVLPGKFTHTIGGKEYHGNSMSRNKFLEINYSYIRVVFDKNMLVNNYRILPLDGEIIHRKIDTNDKYWYNRKKDRNPKKSNFFSDMPISKDFHKERFDEEFVLGDIKNVSKYISEIEIYKTKWYSEEYDPELINAIELYCENNNIKYKNNN